MTKEYLNEQDPVFETKIIVTLIAQDTSREALESDLTRMSLAQIGEAMDEGDMVGALAIASCQHLEEGEVAPALMEIGNDGEFFHHGAEEMFPMDEKRRDASRRVREVQADQGWNEQSLSMQRQRFIEEAGLAHAFADWLEAAAEAENRMALDMDDPDGP